MSGRSRYRGLAAGALALALAASPRTRADAPAAAPAGDQAAARGRVAADARGKLRDTTPAEARMLADALEQRFASRPATAVQLRRDGTAMMRLRGRFQAAAVATVEGGAARTSCVTTPAEADAVAKRASAPPPDLRRAARPAEAE